MTVVWKVHVEKTDISIVVLRLSAEATVCDPSKEEQLIVLSKGSHHVSIRWTIRIAACTREEVGVMCQPLHCDGYLQSFVVDSIIRTTCCTS